MDKERKLVSVIIPTFNRIDVLRRTLPAFFEQTYPKESYEIIVVDDGSTEPIVQMSEDLGRKYPSYTLKYLRQDNRGPAAARNKGIKQASGELILITDDNCVPAPKLIEEHILFYEYHSKENIAILGHTQLHPEIEITPSLNLFIVAHKLTIRN